MNGANGQVLNTYNVSEVDNFEFVESTVDDYPFAEFAADNKNNIVFHLTKDLQFKMIKVQGGSYALQSSDLKWTTAQKTRTLSDYYIAEFECTQAVWTAVNGSVPSGQSATGDDMPVAMVSWNDIMGSGSNTRFRRIESPAPYGASCSTAPRH